jgi:hypothetical protein
VIPIVSMPILRNDSIHSFDACAVLQRFAWSFCALTLFSTIALIREIRTAVRVLGMEISADLEAGSCS